MAVAVDPATGALYAGFEMGGLFRSADGGRSWVWSGQGLGDRRIKVVAVGAPGEIYAVAETREKRLEILGSGDHGGSWSLLSTVPAPLSFRLAPGTLVSGGEPGTLYFAAYKDLWKSTNRGRSWSRILQAKIWFNAVAAGPPGSSEVYAGTAEPGAQVLRSADGGATWTALAGLPSGAVNGLAVAPGGAGRPTKIYAGIGRSGVFESIDGGATWRQPDPAYGALELYAVTVDAVDPSTVYAAYRAGRDDPFQVRVSRDGGATWQSGGLLMGDAPPAGGVRLTSVKGVLYAASEIDLAASDDRGATWSYRLRGGTGLASEEGKIRFDPKAPATVYAVVGARAFKSADGGRTWSSFATSLVQNAKVVPRDLAVDPVHPGTLYAAGDTGVFKSTDGGERWSLIEKSPAQSVAILPSGTVLAGGCGLQRSTDGGATWEEVLPSQAPDGGRCTIPQIVPDPAAPGTVFLALAVWLPEPVEYRIYRSRDNGRTWTPIISETTVLALSPRPPSILYVVRGEEVLESRDGGDTFRRAGLHHLPLVPLAKPVSDLLVDPEVPTTLYAATRGFGLQRSTDGGATWERLTAESTLHPENRAPDYILGLAADPVRPGVLYLSTGALKRVELDAKASASSS
jgi:photosystem II stability/assembly factor-like uncharacterized protein